PYSYFVAHRLAQLERAFDVVCDVRIVYPIAVRDPDFFQRGDPLWETYFMKDIYRTAAFLGLPFRWPRPDPVVRDMKTRLDPREQPYISRLSRLGVAACERGRGLPFLDEVSR
ncbi:MAG TPA: 2-hydroxychromene-2-carboxylate isomerase, partial [Terricaulis sp.]|nr:2-hydroxychromene-2-carboxylate isomerase [Terricaulis sp.]